MTRKPSKKTLTRKLDQICSRIVRSKGYCQICGMTEYEKLQCAHIYSRTYRNTRWDFDNLLSLCASCHFEGHRKPIWFADHCRRILGRVKFYDLMQKHNQVRKWTAVEMQEYLTELTKQSESSGLV